MGGNVLRKTFWHTSWLLLFPGSGWEQARAGQTFAVEGLSICREQAESHRLWRSLRTCLCFAIFSSWSVLEDYKKRQVLAVRNVTTPNACLQLTYSKEACLTSLLGSRKGRSITLSAERAVSIREPSSSPTTFEKVWSSLLRRVVGHFHKRQWMNTSLSLAST